MLTILSLKCQWEIVTSWKNSLKNLTRRRRFLHFAAYALCLLETYDCWTQPMCVQSEILPKALNVAMCSNISSGWLGRGCHTRPSTSCLRQMHGISDGLTMTENRNWLVARFTCRETTPRGAELWITATLFLDIPVSCRLGISDGHRISEEDEARGWSLVSSPREATQLQCRSPHFKPFPELIGFDWLVASHTGYIRIEPWVGLLKAEHH